MSKTKIEWADYTINPVKGLCPMACDYCYARRMYKRFKWDETIRYIEPGFTIDEIQRIKKPSRIFWGSTFELFHDNIPVLWIKDIIKITNQFPQHTHIFLTKCPQTLPKEWPDNCWVGVSAWNTISFLNAQDKLIDIQAKIKFVSLEPLLHWDEPLRKEVQWRTYQYINWLIIGQQTPIKASTAPKVEWIREIVDAADQAKIPVFLKDNLRSVLPLPERIFCAVHPTGVRFLRQEFPLQEEMK